MRIGELADRTGTRTSTLRYCEARGLLKPPERTPGGYRSYGQESVPRIEFVHRAQAAGLTLAQAGDVLEIRDGGGSSCEHVDELLVRRLQGIDEQIEELRALRSTVADLRARATEEAEAECDPRSICRYL